MAKSTVKQGEVVESREVALVRSDTSAMQTFAVGIQEFLARTREAEESALATLEDAKALKAPRSIADDEEVQTFVKEAKAAKKTIGELWGVCSVVDQFHKRLVGMRKRPEAALEEAAQIAIRLHDVYAEADRKRVAEEQERKRRAEELKAQQARDAELARLETEAVKAEEAGIGLSPREEAFVTFYLGYGGGPLGAQDAARRAGFTDPLKSAVRLTSLPKILAAIKAKREAEAIRQQAAAVKEQPLEVKQVDVRSRVSSTPGLRERKTYSCEVVDLERFIDAVLKGAVSADVIMPNQTKLNDEAGRIKDAVLFAQAFPGCELREKKSNW
jgi:hypothetical protein